MKKRVFQGTSIWPMAVVLAIAFSGLLVLFGCGTHSGNPTGGNLDTLGTSPEATVSASPSPSPTPSATSTPRFE